jgi:RNA-directed DNA polymerase
MNQPGSKPFEISKQVVAAAWEKVRSNKGAAGVDGVTVEQFAQDYKNNLYKLWNRLSSGSYFPAPVRMVEIPKDGGRGTRVLGVPTVQDRVAQTVAVAYLEPVVEAVFHPDSYGYRPGRSPLDAVATCRQRCWRYAWVIDLDIQGFFDNFDHDLILKAVAHHTDDKWILCMSSGGLPRRCGSRMDHLPPGIGAARKARRSRRCWLTCSCITPSPPGWRGSSRTCRSSDSLMT